MNLLFWIESSTLILLVIAPSLVHSPHKMHLPPINAIFSHPSKYLAAVCFSLSPTHIVGFTDGELSVKFLLL